MGVLPPLVVQYGGRPLFRGSGWGYDPVWGYRMGVHPYLWVEDGGSSPICDAGWGYIPV